MERKFCYLCGGKLKTKSEHSWECQGCGQSFYRNAQTGIGIILINEHNEVLLARRANEPSKGMYDVPGGFVEPHESLEQAAYRELKEETGIKSDQVEKFYYAASGPNKYPWGKDIIYTCDVIFCAHVKKDAISFRANDDVASLEWMPIEEIAHEMLFVPAAKTALQKI